MLDFVRKVAMKRPVLQIVVYDEDEMSFSRPHPVKVQNALADQGWASSPLSRAKRLLKPKGDNITQITFAKPFHTEFRDGEDRVYIMIKGRYFSFKPRLGRNYFDPKTDDLRAQMGMPDGQYVTAMIDYYFPDLCKKSDTSVAAGV